MAVRPIDADELLAFPYSESAGTDEQIENWIEECGLSDEEVIDRAKKLCWTVIDGFINVVKTEPALTPPNEPLTSDELLKMDGEPVYVVFRPDISGERSQSWALVNVDEKYGEVYLVDSIPGASCYYDEIWADLEGIYRRPPEGEANA